jgi:hypothetical protein
MDAILFSSEDSNMGFVALATPGGFESLKHFHVTLQGRAVWIWIGKWSFPSFMRHHAFDSFSSR